MTIRLAGVKMGRNRQRLSSIPRNVWVVTVTSFLTDVSSEMVANLLPLFLFNVLGARTSAIGLIDGTAETVSSLLKIVSGKVSDRVGSRKWLAVAGYALSTAAKPFLYFASSWGWVLGVRSADRIGKGVRTAPRDALVADTVSEDQRGLAFGLHRAGDTGGAVIGLAVALAIVFAAGEGTSGLDRSVFQTIVLLSLIPAVLAVLALAVGAQEARRQVVTPLRDGSQRPSLDLRFYLFLGIVVVFTLGNASDSFLILRAQNAGLRVASILGMLITFNLIYAITAGPAGALSDRIGRRKLLVAGWIVYAAVYGGFALLRSGWQAWALMAVYGIYYGLTEGAARALVADLVTAEQRGTAYGLYHAAIGIGALPASLIAGVLWQGVGSWGGLGPSAPFAFGGTMAALAALLLMSPALRPGARASS
jgi:MFS family permease